MDALPAGVLKRIPLKGMRGAIARRMLESATTKPQVTLQARVSADRLLAFLAARRVAWAAAAGAPVTLTALLARLVALALTRDPRLNGHMAEGVITLHSRVNLGMAVALDDGLVVPVIKGAQDLSVPALARILADLAERARARRLTLDDVSDGTFTVTNLGMFGVESFNPLVNPPQLGILGLGALRPEPVVRDGMVAIASQLPLSLTFDHAAVDGAQAAQWLRLLADLLADPEAVLEGSE